MSVETLAGKLSTEALGKAVTKADTVGGAPGQGSSFQEILSQVDSGADFAQQVGIGGPSDIDPLSQLSSIDAGNVSYTPSYDVGALEKPNASEKVLDMLGEVNKGQQQMDSLVNQVLNSGKKFSNQELLVIQAHVFHFAQMTELTVKVAEQTVSSFKAVTNTQIQ